MKVINVILITGFLICLALYGVHLYHGQFPDMDVLNHSYPVVTYNGPDDPPDVELERKRPRTWVALIEIPKAVQGAVLVSEDWAFFTHKGYDPAMIENAIKEDLAKGKFKRGASTLTQQVVKNVFLEKDKTLWRKAKKKILEVYFNIAEWGQGVYGIRAAAQAYFQKHPSELTAKEGAFLAMLLPSPKRYSQSYRAKKLTLYASKTILNILRNMERAGYIDAGERSSQAQTPLGFEEKALGGQKGDMEPEPDPDREDTEEVPVGSSKLHDSSDE